MSKCPNKTPVDSSIIGLLPLPSCSLVRSRKDCRNSSAKSKCCVSDIEDRSLLLAPKSIVFKHAGVYTRILAFNIQTWGWCHGVEDKVVVAMGTEFVTAKFHSISQAPNAQNKCYLSSNSCAFFRKHFLHFLHANVYEEASVSPQANIRSANHVIFLQ